MTDAQARLVLDEAPLVDRLAARLCRRLPPSVARDDLVQCGWVALCEAARRWRPESGVPFGGYASPRVSGAMLDWLRAGYVVSGAARSRRRAEVVQVPLASAARAAGSPGWDRLDAALDVERLVQRLPDPRVRAVLRAGARGVSQQAVARALGLSAARVSQLQTAGVRRARAVCGLRPGRV